MDTSLARPDQARVTSADRDQVVDYVKAAYAEGRCDKEELEQALERAMTARTYGELVPIVTELYGDQVSLPPAAAVRVVPVRGAQRAAAATAHLLAPLGIPIVGPLAVLLLGGRKSPFVRKHAVESLNFQLTVVGASFALPLTVVGVLLVPVIWVAAFVLSIVGGVAALRGDEDYRYPYTARPIKEKKRLDPIADITAPADRGRSVGRAGQ
ncbi:DUF1707 and DUF4870 domain-containing protein [Nonomuraea polychroma]|uniref:DUF1707 and DUF4870 domain-containing protein n=1 Tax=Nonomuraea polychroma TaxID=46176 RepID=UPI003D926B26